LIFSWALYEQPNCEDGNSNQLVASCFENREWGVGKRIFIASLSPNAHVPNLKMAIGTNTLQLGINNDFLRQGI
jgi:hypothetical protein